MTRLNITLPDEIASELKKKPNKSRFIAEALKEKLRREKQSEINRLLEEGYKARAEEDAKLASEWESVDLEGWE